MKEQDITIPDGYRIKENLTSTPMNANIVAVIMALPLMLAFSIPYYLVWGEIISLGDIINLREDIFIVLGLILGGLIVHELLHGLGWAMFTKNGFKSVKFGIVWHMLMPYCHCKEPLPLRAYLFGGLLPSFVLGLIPCGIALYIGHMGWMVFGLFFTLAAGGDFLVAWMLRKQKKGDFIQDHPSKVGCVLLEKTDG